MLAPSVFAHDIYTCRAKNGTMSYQDIPCEQGKKTVGAVIDTPEARAAEARRKEKLSHEEDVYHLVQLGYLEQARATAVKYGETNYLRWLLQSIANQQQQQQQEAIAEQQQHDVDLEQQNQLLAAQNAQLQAQQAANLQAQRDAAEAQRDAAAARRNSAKAAMDAAVARDRANVQNQAPQFCNADALGRVWCH